MYLKRLCIVLIITASLAYMIGRLFDYIYIKRWSALFFEKTDVLVNTNTNYDIIFLGNSRVHFGINPYYIDSVTKSNSYNCANGGADAEAILMTSSIYLQKHPAPKLAVISLDMNSLNKNDLLKTCFHYLFYLENDTISKYMKSLGYPTDMIRILPFTKYSFFDEYNRTSLFIKGKEYPVFRHNIYKGFLNIHPDMNSNVTDVFNIKPILGTLFEAAVNDFKNTISAFQQKGTTVVFIYPPERNVSLAKHIDFRRVTDSVFKTIAIEYNVKEFHFENDPRYTDSYFVDDIHLNEPGSRIYSIQLGDSIKSIYH